MNEFYKFLSSNPNIVKLSLGVLFFIICIVTLLFTVGFIQGREISFWPPKIGALPKQVNKKNEEAKGHKSPTTGTDLNIIEKNIDPLIKQGIVIKINNPKNGEVISQFATVEYSIKGQIPEGYKPLLIVRDPLGQYWSWGYSPSGSHSRVQFGISLDSQKEFEIGVLVINKNLPRGQPTQNLPDGIAFGSITVIRR